MGCFKLTYNQAFETPLKVVYTTVAAEQKTVQRFLRVDPLAHKYPNMTSYVFTGNNPVMLVDPDGREIVAPEGSAERDAYNKFKSEVLARFQSAETDQAKETYKAILDELGQLEQSKTKYHLVGNGGKFTYNTEKEQIEVQFSLEDNNRVTSMESLAHELKHASQFENQQLDLVIDLNTKKVGGGMLYDKTDELEAYNRGNLFGYGASNDPELQLKILNPKAYIDKNYKNLSWDRKGIGPPEKGMLSKETYDFIRNRRAENLRYIIN